MYVVGLTLLLPLAHEIVKLFDRRRYLLVWSLGLRNSVLGLGVQARPYITNSKP